MTDRPVTTHGGNPAAPPPTADAARTGLAGSVLILLLLLVIHLAPAALGANRPLPWFYNATLAGMLLVGIAVGAIFASGKCRGRQVTFRPVALPLLLCGTVAVWAAIQIVPVIDPLPGHPVWAFAEEAGGGNWPARISVDPVAGLLALIRFATAVCVFAAVYLVCRVRHMARFFLAVFAWAAVAYAIYGMARLVLPADKVLWFDTVSAGVPAGPFLNRNNAATYFGLGALSTLGVIWLRQQKSNPVQAANGRALVALVNQISGRNSMWITVFVVLACSVFLTGSRAGSLAFVTSLGAFFLFAQRVRSVPTAKTRPGAARLVTWIGAAAAVLAVAGGSALLAGGTLGGRIAELGLEPGGRTTVYPPTLAALRDNVVAGSGFGTFEDVLPHYRAGVDVTRHVWDKAHNDYLELFLGLGVPMALVFLGALALLVRQIHRGLAVRRRDQAYCVVALSASVLVGIHAMADFSLQIQAVALAFSMLLGIGAAQSTPTYSATID